jgi:hypothetical protein
MACSSSTEPEADAAAGEDGGAKEDGRAGQDAKTEADHESGSHSDAGVDGRSDASVAGDGGEASTFDCAADDGGGELPNDLRCTGLYSDWDNKTIASDLLAYTPGYILWSDGALKQRWAYIPPKTQIDNSNLDEWTFPIGTKFFKEFSFGSLRIETRLFMKVGGTPIPWVWATYRWSADGLSSAVRLDNGESNVNGTTYEIPNHSECAQCHEGRLDYNLGFDAINLGTAAAQGVSLAALMARNLLTVPVPSSIEIPDDGTGLARASFGWWHSNCGVACHNRNSSAGANGTGLFMRVSAAQLVADAGAVHTSDLDTFVTAVGVVPTLGQFATAGYYLIKPGDPALSLIPTLDDSRGDPNTPQMPPIISHQVDTTDVDATEHWIMAMPVDAGE